MDGRDGLRFNLWEFTVVNEGEVIGDGPPAEAEGYDHDSGVFY